MKAIAVYPGMPHSMHLEEVPMPAVDDVPDGRGVLVKVLRVGVDGTDKEINAAEYGNAPPGDDFLIIGHESFGDAAEYLVKVPRELRQVGVLMEPSSVAEKAINQAYEIQRRLRVWQPRRALVLGSGTLGLLATTILRLRGLEVVTMGRTERPYLNADLLDEIGATYLTTASTSVAEAARRHGPFD